MGRLTNSPHNTTINMKHIIYNITGMQEVTELNVSLLDCPRYPRIDPLALLEN